MKPWASCHLHSWRPGRCEGYDSVAPRHFPAEYISEMSLGGVSCFARGIREPACEPCTDPRDTESGDRE